MGTTGTISYSGLYPGEAGAPGAAAISSAKPDKEEGKSGNRAPALAFVGILIALVILRAIYEWS